MMPNYAHIGLALIGPVVIDALSGSMERGVLIILGLVVPLMCFAGAFVVIGRALVSVFKRGARK